VDLFGAAALNDAVADAAANIVLRYGLPHAPGTGFNTPHCLVPMHVDAAAKADYLARNNGTHGIYNVAEDDGTVAIDKAEGVIWLAAEWRPKWLDLVTGGRKKGRLRSRFRRIMVALSNQ
jgi:hypothetical protein